MLLTQDCKIQTSKIEIQQTLVVKDVDYRNNFKPLSKIISERKSKQDKGTDQPVIIPLIIVSIIAAFSLTIPIGYVILRFVAQRKGSLPFRQSAKVTPLRRITGAGMSPTDGKTV